MWPPGTGRSSRSARLGGRAREELDATGLWVLPGGIDVHVHCDEPGRTEWEGFATATAALAAGGMTSFIDMPLNSTPATVDVEAFDRKLAAATAAARVDFALWGGLVPGHLDELEGMHARGAIGFKAFMSETGVEDFRPADDATLLEGMRRAAHSTRSWPCTPRATSSCRRRASVRSLRAAPTHAAGLTRAHRPRSWRRSAGRSSSRPTPDAGCTSST